MMSKRASATVAIPSRRKMLIGSTALAAAAGLAALSPKQSRAATPFNPSKRKSQHEHDHDREGLLTPDYCVVAIIALQPQMLFGVANFEVYRSAK